MKKKIITSGLNFFFITILLISCVDRARQMETARITDSITRADNLIRYREDSIQKAINSQVFWQIKYYVDEFGNPTKKGYLSNPNVINGTFSNSATENSKLSVEFLIDNPKSISIQLYEYGGSNPVKSTGRIAYKIKVKSRNEEPNILYAHNNSDRLVLNEEDAIKLSDILMHNGKIQFSIIELSDYSTSSYKFEFDNSDSYQMKLAELKNSKSK